MQFQEEIFRSYDIRGTTDQLSEELAFAVGRATVRLTGAKTVVVGQDMRPTSPLFAKAVIAGIHAEGADAVDIGMCTTTMFNFAVGAYEEHEAGVMVTASHNPPQYNGFKVSRGNAMPVSGTEMLKGLEGLGSSEGLEGITTVLDVTQPYIEKMFELIGEIKLNGMNVAIDAGNGMAGIILPKIFDRLDANLTAMYFDPDGTFPNHEANPIKVETLEDLEDKMVEVEADIGVAFDGDADRIGFLDENGDFVSGDHMLAFLAEDRLRAHPGAAVVWSPNASWAVRDAIVRAGGKSIWEKVGRTNIIKRVINEKAAIGGEVSAHYFYPEFSGMEASEFTMLLVLKRLAESGKKFSELLAPVRMYARSEETNFEVEDKDAVLAALDAKYAKDAVLVERMDGARYEFADWWFNVRKSNTEPLIRLNIEATSPELLKTQQETIAGIIRKH